MIYYHVYFKVLSKIILSKDLNPCCYCVRLVHVYDWLVCTNKQKTSDNIYDKHCFALAYFTALPVLLVYTTFILVRL